LHRRAFIMMTILLSSGALAHADGTIAVRKAARRLAVDIHSEKRRGSMNGSVQALCQKITNIFEVDDPLGDYAYVEDLRDGRGFTVTHYGFCENTGDLNAVIKAAGLEDVLELKTNRKKFPANWKKCHRDSASRSKLIAAGDSVARRLYWEPATKAVKEDNLSDNPFAYAVYYDTIIQHGGGDDPDSFYAIRREAGGDLRVFLNVRRRVLLHATDPDTREAWRKSVDRVDALEELSNNPELTGDLKISGHRVRGLS
jgi:chitosanase